MRTNSKASSNKRRKINRFVSGVWHLHLMVYCFLLFSLATAASCNGGAPDEVTQKKYAQLESREAAPHFRTYGEASEWYQSQSDLDWMYPDSTSIHKAAYHHKDGVLLIFFKSNKTLGYVYGGVPPIVWRDFKKADSKGTFFHFHIKGAYRYKLEGDFIEK